MQSSSAQNAVLLLYPDTVAKPTYSPQLASQLMEAHYEVHACPASNVPIADSVSSGRYSHVIIDADDGQAHSSLIAQVSAYKIPIVLFMNKSDHRLKVTALNNGVDRVLEHPCDKRELLAHLRALSRVSEPNSASVIRLQGLKVDMLGRRAFQNGKPLPLSPVEFMILKTLAMSAGRLVSLEQIQTAVGPCSQISGVSVRVSMHRLRSKLKKAQVVHTINTIVGQGYSLTPAPIQ